MKSGVSLVGIIVGYLAIGIVIGLGQLGLSKLFEPPCNGQIEHRLWQAYDKHLILGAARWMPDLYDHLIAGDMTIKDYLLGGYRCITHVPLQPLFLQPTPPKLFQDGGVIVPGRRTAKLLEQQHAGPAAASESAANTRLTDQFVTVEVLPGVTMDLPADWQAMVSEPIAPRSDARENTDGLNQSPLGNLKLYYPSMDFEGVGVSVATMKPPPQEFVSVMDRDLSHLVAWMEKSARLEVERQGLKMSSFEDVRREMVGQWPALGFTVRIINPNGSTFPQQYLLVLTPTRSVIFTEGHGTGPSTEFKSVLKKIRQTLKIAY